MSKILIAAILSFGLSILSAWAAPKAPAPKAPASTPELIAKGKAAFTTNCVLCHGDKGDGNGPAGAMMKPKPRHFGKEKFKAGGKPEQLFSTITNGLKGTSMAPFGHIPEEERWGLAYYVLELAKQK